MNVIVWWGWDYWLLTGRQGGGGSSVPSNCWSWSLPPPRRLGWRGPGLPGRSCPPWWGGPPGGDWRRGPGSGRHLDVPRRGGWGGSPHWNKTPSVWVRMEWRISDFSLSRPTSVRRSGDLQYFIERNLIWYWSAETRGWDGNTMFRITEIHLVLFMFLYLVLSECQCGWRRLI